MRLVKLLRNFFPIILLILIPLVFFYPVWLEKKVPLPADVVVGAYFPWLDYNWGYPAGVSVKNPITSDAISFSFPMRMLAIDLMKDGEWPLWNPYILSGTPLLANFQSAPFSPTNFVYFLTDTLTGWSLQVILQHLLAAIFTYLLLRNWGISKTSSVFGGIIFAFSGFNLIWSQWNAHALTAAFIPLAILLVDRWGRSGNIWTAFGLSIVLALQIFSGYPQIVFYSLIAIFLFWFIVFWSTGKFWRKTLLLLIFTLLGLGISAIQALPGYELMSLSQRVGEVIPLEWAFLSWEQVITFLAPDFFGNHATGNYWGPKNYTSVVGFVGVVSIILAFLTLYQWRDKKEVKFLILLTVLSLLLAFPTPISLFLWQTNPLGIQAGVSLRALVLFTLSISLMAAIGMDYVLGRTKTSLKISILVPTIILLSFLFYAFFGIHEEWQQKVAIRNLILPFASLVGVLIAFLLLTKWKIPKQLVVCGFFLILLTELFYFGWKFTPFVSRHIVYPETPIIEFLKNQKQPFRFDGANVVPANLFIPYKIESISGYDAVYPFEMAKFIGVINSNDAGAKPQDRYGIITNRESPLINTKYVLVKGGSLGVVDIEKYKEVFRDKSVVVLENKDALPRAFMVFDWETEGDSDKILQKMLDSEFEAGKKIFLSELVLAKQSTLTNLTKGIASEVKYLSYKEQENILNVSTPVYGFLFVDETWYPGWKAFVDGIETKIYKANYTFRAINVPAGEHEIRFVYEPDSFYNGIKITGVSVALLLLLVIFLRRNK